MGRLFVDLAVLERLETALSNAADDLDALARALARASALDLGSRNLDQAAQYFFDQWRYGTGRLGEAAEVVGKQVSEAVRVYRASDAKLANIIRSEQ